MSEDNGIVESGKGQPAPQDPPAGSEREWVPEEYRNDETFNKFTGVGDVFKSYKALESKFGAGPDRILTLPGEGSTPEQWSEIYSKLGRPETKDGYEFAEVDKFKYSDDFKASLADKAFELGMSKGAFKELTKWYGEKSLAEQSARAAEYQQRVEDAKAQLKSEWGVAYDQNQQYMRIGLNRAGSEAQRILQKTGALSYPEVANLLVELGKGNMEHAAINNGGGSSGNGGPMTPKDAKEKIEELRADKEFMKSYQSGDKFAVEKMNRYYGYANPS